MANAVKEPNYNQLETHEINDAVIKFCDELNIRAGSNGDIDLYKLMQRYLTDPEKRKAINEIL